MGAGCRALAAPQVYLLPLLLALLFPSAVDGQVVLNEIMANNLSAVTNGGKTPDWVELYNTSAVAFSIAGYGLTESSSTPLKYVFPPGTSVPGLGRLVVWCDSDNTAPGLHSGFTLKSNGKKVSLYFPGSIPGSIPVDSIAFGIQAADLTIGRFPEGTGGWVLTHPTPSSANQTVALGSITNLSINEWMATNSVPPGNDWLELYNRSTNPVALAGLVFTTDLPPTVPTNRPIPALSFIAGLDFVQFFCIGNKAKNADELDFKLSSSNGETNTLYSQAGAIPPAFVIDQIRFPGNNGVPGYWIPDISYGRLPDGGTNIVRFDVPYTTPGSSNYFLFITNVIINEALSHTDPPLEDAIELYNPTAAPVDISNWWLSNTPSNLKKFRVPTNTIIAPGGYKVFYEQIGISALPHIGFNTSGTGNSPDFTLNSAHGDSVQLYTGDAAGNLTGYRTSVSFGPAQHGIAFGRYVTSVGEDFTAMSSNTFGMDNPATVSQFRTGTGLLNAYPRVGPLVINEIMYHPPDIAMGLDNTLDEYIEIYNITPSPVALYDTNGLYFDSSVGFYADGRTNTWRLRGVADFDFPTNVSLGAGQSLLVVSFNPTANPPQLNSFRSKYGIPAAVPVFGPYSGSLSNDTASVNLDKPDPPQDPSHPDFRFVPYIRVDRVVYSNSFPWPTQPNGTGKALQRFVPEYYGNDSVNWGAADPTPGRQSLRIVSAQQAANSLVLGFNGLAGSSYSVQYNPYLGSGAWSRLISIGPLVNSGWQQITNSLTSSNRFYRLVTPAQ